MEQKEVEFWTYGCKDGKIHINFDKQERYIEISIKDLRSMVNWVAMDLGTYDPFLTRKLLP